MRTFSFRVSGFLLLALLVSIVFSTAVFGQDNRLIVGGKSIGPVTLGQPVSNYSEFLGNHRPMSSTFYDYPKHGIAVLLDRGNVKGITVYSKDFATPEGVRVGDPVSKLKSVYGNFLKTDAGALTYSDLGLAFNENGGKISRIMVIYASPDQLLGDRMIVPNTRAGNIKIGDDIQQVLRVWGEPDSRDELRGNNKISVYKYNNKAVSVLVHNSQIVGVRINSYKYRTPQGISVNSTKDEVFKAYGKNYKQVEESFMYNSLGIGFFIHKDKVVEILLTYRKE